MAKIYAGIGSRETPADIQTAMPIIARNLTTRGWLLRSGHADGADRAFELGTMKREIHLPWNGYNGGMQGREGFGVPHMSEATFKIAAEFHLAWDRLSQGVQKLMARNVTIVLGEDLCTPVKMIICWTPRGQITGGTGQALRMAAHYQIPVFNRAIDADWDRVDPFVQGITP